MPLADQGVCNVPNRLYTVLVKRMDDLEKEVIKGNNDVKWLKYIIMGAAGLGFVEKIFGWILK